jgi:cell division protein FtsW (lipid II flippase)
MALDYIALVLLIVILALVVYGLVAVWSIPYEIAKGRNHPHTEAIGVATWVSLFTLGILWPFLWIWATAWSPERGWGFSSASGNAPANPPPADLERRVSALEAALKQR